jgi:hypothetical protein
VDFQSLFVGLVLGVAACVAFYWMVQKTALSMHRQAANARGRQVQEEDKNEHAVALAEAVALFQGEGSSEDKMKKGLGLLVKYPRSAAWLYKQYKTFQAKGVEGVLSDVGQEL